MVLESLARQRLQELGVSITASTFRGLRPADFLVSIILHLVLVSITASTFRGLRPNTQCAMVGS